MGDDGGDDRDPRAGHSPIIVSFPWASPLFLVLAFGGQRPYAIYPWVPEPAGAWHRADVLCPHPPFHPLFLITNHQAGNVFAL